MPAGLDAAEYVAALETGIGRATTNWTPELVLISAGFDSLRGDPLGGFTLEPADLAGVTERLVARAEEWCGGAGRERAGGGLPRRPARRGRGRPPARARRALIPRHPPP